MPSITSTTSFVARARRDDAAGVGARLSGEVSKSFAKKSPGEDAARVVEAVVNARRDAWRCVPARTRTWTRGVARADDMLCGGCVERYFYKVRELRARYAKSSSMDALGTSQSMSSHSSYESSTLARAKA
jgi:hypothetical protein